MAPVVDTFERKARKVRRALRRSPVLEPLANRLGTLAWRWHLRRSASRSDDVVELPVNISIDPQSIEMAPATDAPGRTAGEVAVVFGRTGRPRVVSGSCRVEEARRLGRREISARVADRHPRWARTATEVRAYARQRGGRAYQPYLHPDLADVPSDQGHERFEILLDALPIRSGILVDLGANAGYFSHRFEAAGFECIAVERSEKEAYFLAALREACGRKFRIAKGSLTQVELPARVDVVLALNIFHHFLKADSTYRELQGFLRRLDTRYMLFEPHLAGDQQMVNAPHDMPPERFVKHVATLAGLEVDRELGRAADGRPLYLLTAPAHPS